MSRAIRRQQGSRGRGSAGGTGGAPPSGGDDGGGGGRLRPFGPRGPRQTRGIRPQEKRRRIGVPTWMSEIWSELRKVTWPTRDETAYLTMVVIVVAVAVGVVLGLVDVFFNWLIDQLLLK
ncbi:MAG TPA: preprotein translocase subunit SecE [Dehalococcoidia bacterium]